MLTGNTPSFNNKQFNLDPNENPSAYNASDFLKKLLEIDPEKRPRAVNALNDRWLLNITKNRKVS